MKRDLALTVQFIAGIIGGTICGVVAVFGHLIRFYSRPPFGLPWRPLLPFMGLLGCSIGAFMLVWCVGKLCAQEGYGWLTFLGASLGSALGLWAVLYGREGDIVAIVLTAMAGSALATLGFNLVGLGDYVKKREMGRVLLVILGVVLAVAGTIEMLVPGSQFVFWDQCCHEVTISVHRAGLYEVDVETGERHYDTCQPEWKCYKYVDLKILCDPEAKAPCDLSDRMMLVEVKHQDGRKWSQYGMPMQPSERTLRRLRDSSPSSPVPIRFYDSLWEAAHGDRQGVRLEPGEEGIFRLTNRFGLGWKSSNPPVLVRLRLEDGDGWKLPRSLQLTPP